MAAETVKDFSEGVNAFLEKENQILKEMKKVSVIGAGTMGMGIAQIAATYGHSVCLYDNFKDAIKIAQDRIENTLRLIEKIEQLLNQRLKY